MSYSKVCRRNPESDCVHAAEKPNDIMLSAIHS